MAHLLGADRVTLALGTRVLLDAVSLGLDDAQRIGVVGPNGAGKSTLLRVLAGVQEPDDGRVTRAGGVRLAMLDQRDDLPAGTVLDAIHGTADAHEWASDPRVRAVHAGLLPDVDLAADVATLSGGQRRRVALAALLVGDDEVLVLDEPTNHLDVEGVAWLAEHLNQRFARGSGALVVVTHDRWFLDAVCTRTWEVHDGAVDQYDGGYAAYVLARAERARTAAVTEEKRQNLLRKELAWLRRGAPARTSKPKFRLDAASALIADEPPPRDNLELTRMATARLGKDVLDVEGVTLALGGRTLLDDVTWRIGPGDRFGLVGVNGAGKTSLLRLLSGRLEPGAGRVKRGKTIRVAELRQDVEDLDEVADLRVVEVVEAEKRSVVVGGKELTAAQLVERLGFTRDRARTPVRDLSGGERRRLSLLRLLVGEPNVLLLDEPTNHLDLEMREALAEALSVFEGAIVMVSHDRHLIGLVCDTFWRVADGVVEPFAGDLDEYAAWLRTRASAQGARSKADRVDKGARAPEPAPAPVAEKPAAAKKPVNPHKLEAAEKKVEQLGAALADIDRQLADPANYADAAKMTRLGGERDVLAQQLEQAEAAWMELLD